VGLIARALRAKNLDINTSEDLAAFLRRGEPTWSGMEVSETTAMNVSAFAAGVRYVSEDVGKLPWPVYMRVSDDQRKRATDSPYWRLLHDAPNTWMDSQQFRELGTAITLLRGDFVALKNTVDGGLRELLPVKPGHVTIEQLADFGLIYHVQMASGAEKHFAARDVFHLRGFSLDGVHGMSILGQARQALGLTMALQRHGAAVFKNAARPGGAYKHPGVLSDRAFGRLKSDLDELKGEGAGGALILEEGMDWIAQTGLSNEDAQYLGSQQFQITEFCRFIRIPPHKLFELTRSTNNNIEHQGDAHAPDVRGRTGVRGERRGARRLPLAVVHRLGSGSALGDGDRLVRALPAVESLAAGTRHHARRDAALRPGALQSRPHSHGGHGCPAQLRDHPGDVSLLAGCERDVRSGRRSLRGLDGPAALAALWRRAGLRSRSLVTRLFRSARRDRGSGWWRGCRRRYWTLSLEVSHRHRPSWGETARQSSTGRASMSGARVCARITECMAVAS